MTRSWSYIYKRLIPTTVVTAQDLEMWFTSNTRGIGLKVMNRSGGAVTLTVHLCEDGEAPSPANRFINAVSVPGNSVTPTELFATSPMTIHQGVKMRISASADDALAVYLMWQSHIG